MSIDDPPHGSRGFRWNTLDMYKAEGSRSTTAEHNLQILKYRSLMVGCADKSLLSSSFSARGGVHDRVHPRCRPRMRVVGYVLVTSVGWHRNEPATGPTWVLEYSSWSNNRAVFMLGGSLSGH